MIWLFLFCFAVEMVRMTCNNLKMSWKHCAGSSVALSPASTYRYADKFDDESFTLGCSASWVSGRSDGGYMWISQTCCARRDAVTMAMQHGKACAPSAGGRSTSGYGRNRSRTTGPWQKSKTICCIVTNTFTSWVEKIQIVLALYCSTVYYLDAMMLSFPL